MQLLSINVSGPKTVDHEGRSVTTSIFKQPVTGRAATVRTHNIDGDDQADRRVHGVGVEMAVYLYPAEHYAFWEDELGKGPFAPGAFGENLTVSGLDETNMAVGDTLQIGDTVILQVTQPRIPCFKLAMCLGEGSTFPRRFQDSGRVGFYLKVLEEGQIATGDPVTLIDRDPSRISITAFLNAFTDFARHRDTAERLLQHDVLSPNWHRHFRKACLLADRRGRS